MTRIEGNWQELQRFEKIWKDVKRFERMWKYLKIFEKRIEKKKNWNKKNWKVLTRGHGSECNSVLFCKKTIILLNFSTSLTVQKTVSTNCVRNQTGLQLSGSFYLLIPMNNIIKIRLIRNELPFIVYTRYVNKSHITSTGLEKFLHCSSDLNTPSGASTLQ